MQITLIELALGIIALCLLTLTVVGVRISFRVADASRRVEDTHQYITYLRPRVERFLDESSAELDELKLLTRSLGRVAGRADEVTGEMRQLLIPALVRLRNLDGAGRYVSAAMVGARVGMAALRRESQSDEPPQDKADNGHRAHEAEETRP